MNIKSCCFPLLITLTTLATLAGHASAQETPTPAAELQKYAPLIGHWQGSGTAQMGPGEPSKWESRSSYSWALDKFFVQEDTVVKFADMPKPLVMRAYLGWDAENQRYVSVAIDNDGGVGVSQLVFADDGAMVQILEKVQDGQTFIERYSSKVTGDTMTFAIDMMGLSGPSTQAVKGSMRRVDKAAPLALDASSFTSKAGPAILQVGKSAGTFAVKATMTMAPGMPEMNISGTDVVSALFDGTIVHVHTTGTAEGLPGNYIGELFYGIDPKTQGLTAVIVSNMGEVGQMNCTFTADNKQLIFTSTMHTMGQPSVQHMIMDLDDSGAPTKAVGHSITGNTAPLKGWNATYTKK